MHSSLNTWTLLFLGITIANIAFVGWRMRAPAESQLEKASSYTYVGHDYPETLPLPFTELPLVEMTVEESNDFPVLGADSDDAWASLASPTFGHVRLGDADRLFMVTMYHEFHCLRILNLAFGRAEIAGLAHIRHCLNYLRLGALCASDLTLEPGDFERRDFDHERTGATHTCRDWRAAGRIMEDNLYAWRNKTGEGEL